LNFAQMQRKLVFQEGILDFPDIYESD